MGDNPDSWLLGHFKCFVFLKKYELSPLSVFPQFSLKAIIYGPFIFAMILQ